jgi:BirA family biotin operon repressor/biotin-[acetyl-CoA-carboxylase] ligase
MVFATIDSTNAFALAHADDEANDGLVILAEQQTAGRGQQGRTWACPGGAGVLMSCLTFPPKPICRPAILTAWAGVSVCETILKATGLQATMKWPNDVLIDSYKVCGILMEQAHGTVVGIGLNVNQPAEFFAAAGLPHAASLAMLTGQQRNTHDLARLLIAELDAEYGRLRQGNLNSLESRWQARLGVLAKQVEIETTTEVHRGRIVDIRFDRLELKTAQDATVALAPETIRHLHVLDLQLPAS